MDYRSILKQYWGYDNFRGIQEDIINSIGSGQDTLGLMPTGGGKSITFQVPALATAGVMPGHHPLDCPDERPGTKPARPGYQSN